MGINVKFVKKKKKIYKELVDIILYGIIIEKMGKFEKTVEICLHN